MRDYTLIGFYADTYQRFAHSLEAADSDAAEVACLQEFPGVVICGVIAGEHATVDTQEYVTGRKEHL